MKRLLLTIIACFAFVGVSMAQSTLERAESLFDSGSYEEAFKLFRLVDDIVEHDFALGIEWLKKAAENGHADSMYLLGHCYENGLGVLKNSNDAIFWYRKASDLGHEDATERLEQIDEY